MRIADVYCKQIFKKTDVSECRLQDKQKQHKSKHTTIVCRKNTPPAVSSVYNQGFEPIRINCPLLTVVHKPAGFS